MFFGMDTNSSSVVLAMLFGTYFTVSFAEERNGCSLTIDESKESVEGGKVQYAVGEVAKVECKGQNTFSDSSKEKNFTCVADDVWNQEDNCMALLPSGFRLDRADRVSQAYSATTYGVAGSSIGQNNALSEAVNVTSACNNNGDLSYSTWLCFLCFAGAGQVTTSDGRPVALRDVTVGQRVLVMKEDRSLAYEPVTAMVHKNPHQEAFFVELMTEFGKKITLTPLHYMLVVQDGDRVHRLAEDVAVGDVVVAVDAETSDAVTETVVGKRVVQERGIYAPVTPSGTVVVDSVVASVYVGGFRGVLSDPRAQHSASWPLRAGLPFKEALSSGSHMPAWVHTTMLVYAGLCSV